MDYTMDHFEEKDGNGRKALAPEVHQWEGDL
jgi:hypothetical protein